MKTIKKDELFKNLSGFLKSKGIELQDGSYTQRIRQGCNLLADAVNTTQKTARQARAKAGQQLDQLRQTIHKATAPQPPPAGQQPKSRSPRAAGKETVRTKKRK